ncbi:50S ribosomal protein L15 [Thermosulfurimonas marina]|uniref:Large ribosomal subunit protein uL15 n=1 Tax=Thermosulfurimonas marina TaxID=2047767 RepID=A0A6H1WUU7_9BACT|nr:50S ribosomal protein L15 [Thermosulfurimonas marina]QJA06960.1 50S ribosomal protein L15 [Thermosulfurimonas marina]
MTLSNLKPFAGSKHREKRVGRGPGSGHGKTSCRGQKGQRSRSGGGVPPWFEGGQMPLIRRLPKRGFKNPFRVEYAVVNVRDLARRFSAGAVIDVEALRQAGLVKGRAVRVKLLGDGEIDFAVTVRVHAASKSAREKIERAGGSVEIVEA